MDEYDSKSESQTMECSSDASGGDTWQDGLQTFRILIIERIHYQEVSPALQSLKVIDMEDDEELRNPFTLRTAKLRNNRLVDIILRKGEENYKKFLKVIGVYYPDLYTEMTGQKPESSNFKLLRENIRGPDNQELVQLLMQALEGMKQKCFDQSKQLERSNVVLEERTQEIERLKQKIEDSTHRVARYENIDNEMVGLRKEVDRLKNENYTVCMRMYDANEENRKLREMNISMKNENDKLTVELQKMESCVALERTQSVRLRNRLECSPSDRDIMDMKREIDELRLKLAKANSQKFRNEDIDMRIKILQHDKDEAIEMYAEALENLNKLREDCSSAENLKNKYLDEKEQLDLTCKALRSDCDMYKMRRDIVWQQLQEVEKEREILMKERNDAQLNTKICMQEKAKYRTQIRELEENYDQVTLRLLERDRELVRLRSKTVDVTEGNLNDRWFPSRNVPVQICDSCSSTVSSGHPSLWSDSGQFRKRAYITKHYQKFSNKTESLVDGLVEDFGPHINVFPEVNMAADYGPQDGAKLNGEHPSTNKNERIPRRRLAKNKRHLNNSEKSTGENASFSHSSDE